MTRDYHRGPKKPGDIGDPVADNIRQEQNRDARPSKEEMTVEHRQFLREEGCTVCGEDDPDVLHAALPWSHPCSGTQNPPAVPVVYCDEHLDQRKTLASWKVSQTKAAMRDDDVAALVWYECKMNAEAEIPMRDDGTGPVRYGTPSAPVRCPRCGATLDYVDYLEYEEADQ